MKRKPTIRDVARKTNLSISTVSLVLNNKANVSNETRQKVQEVITSLGYHPQRSARGLASRSSGNIGFILTDDHFSQAEPFYTKIFLGTEFEARKHNYYVLLTTVARTVKETKEVPRFLLEHNVDGIIIAGKIGASWISYIRERNIPVVLIDYDLPRLNVSSVMMDNKTGSRLIVEHLHKGGHTKIGFIGGDIQHPSIAERYDGYRLAMEELKLPIQDSFSFIDEPNTQIINGFEAAKKIFFNKSERPTAIFAANDAMAIGCIQYLKQAKWKIPNDVAIAGFDNIEAGLHIEPRLTTINVLKEEMGSLALRRIVEMIKDKADVTTRTLTPVELVVRESCGVKKNQLILD